MLSRRRFIGALPFAGVASGSRFSPPADGLVISGQHLLRGGEAIRLRGLAIGDLLKPGRPKIYDYKGIASDWGANAVRLSVHPGYWLADTPGSREKLLANVKAARSIGLVVVVCWHAIGFPGLLTRKPPESFNSLPNAFDASIGAMKAFWTEMAHRFESDQMVIFELFNEPIFDLARLDNDYLTWPRLASFYQDFLKSVIRPVAQNPVILGVNRFSYDFRGVASMRLTDPNVGYAWHVYPRGGKTTRTDWVRRLAGVNKDSFVVVTEWGFSSTAGSLFGTIDDFGKPFVDFLDSNCMSWLAYGFSAVSQPALLEKDWKTLTVEGRFVQGRLKGISLPGCTYLSAVT